MPGEFVFLVFDKAHDIFAVTVDNQTHHHQS